ncbi:hypothetical protein K493DRAFT_332644 [Basidiobolus meristosporus CBS 931.73]|uniref:Transmembrane protein n=1 Tax=Basidiobolus meristosporus CBS 931.73 TaxID=1314790 RepID=A0A1Y1ZBU8_9FUNG|nr:hypothetical protein K493DRAFT_332644 [Basidiobolus meristosporus CBS 931.73]|eukprot:ORY07729.1 hypothetical protein K493DRAFT_332644 [Basidiobolus meristosporus CBS 931.73]
MSYTQISVDSEQPLPGKVLYSGSDSNVLPQEFSAECDYEPMRDDSFYLDVGYTVLGIELISSIITICLLVRHLEILDPKANKVRLAVAQSLWLPMCITVLRIFYSIIGILGLFRSSYLLIGNLLASMALEILGTIGLLVLSVITHHGALIWMTVTTMILDVYFMSIFYRYYEIVRNEKYTPLVQVAKE